jgi:UDP-glucuronate 4-epimerase
MKILVTGSAGFIGFHTCVKLINFGHEVYGIDNINDYYDPKLKFDRLNELGINKDSASIYKLEVKSNKFKGLKFSRLDLVDNLSLSKLFEKEKFDTVCNLAAQAGVRYSIDNPDKYIDSNIVGFLNILEGCRNNDVKHLVYASSSSVYGNNNKVPFSTSDNVDYPISLYAATKKSNELMAHTYSHLYKFSTTGLRFFTVYGPWGRPDMAPMLFANAIVSKKPIKVFNNGNLERDFTYIDDIVDGILLTIEKKLDKNNRYNLYNIGRGQSIFLEKFINILEDDLKIKAIKIPTPMQPGDVYKTLADCSNLKEELNYNPKTSINEGVKSFVEWFNKYLKN